MKTTLDEQRRIVAYLDGLPPALRFGDLRQAKVDAVRGPHKGVILQSQSQEELDALLPSVLRPQGGAFKGEL